MPGCLFGTSTAERYQAEHDGGGHTRPNMKEYRHNNFRIAHAILPFGPERGHCNSRYMLAKTDFDEKAEKRLLKTM